METVEQAAQWKVPHKTLRDLRRSAMFVCFVLVFHREKSPKQPNKKDQPLSLWSHYFPQLGVTITQLCKLIHFPFKFIEFLDHFATSLEKLLLTCACI